MAFLPRHYGREYIVVQHENVTIEIFCGRNNPELRADDELC